VGTCTFTENGTRFHYTWLRARIVSGTPAPQEPHLHDRCGYHHLRALRLDDRRSRGLDRLSDAVDNGTARLDD
jgi:hypothetical protein